MSSPIQKKDFLYPNFLNDSVVYRQNEAYWARFVQQSLEAYTIHPIPWLNKSYGDGTPMYDGNPIYDALLGKNKALRVIQVAPESDALLLSAWIHQTEDEQGEGLEELVVHLQLTKKTRIAALALLEKWVTTDDRTIMETFIDKTIDQLSN
ncbi:MAG: hypothetical protein ACRBFS_24165 [Aureispira sp.]